MAEFLSQFGTLLVASGALIAAGVAIFGQYKKEDSEANKELKSTNKDLIDALRNKVDILDDVVKKQTVDIASLTEQVQKLTDENKRFIEIFQGRDAQTQEFYKKGFAAMEKLEGATLKVDAIFESIKIQNGNVSKLIELASKQIDSSNKTTEALSNSIPLAAKHE